MIAKARRGPVRGPRHQCVPASSSLPGPVRGPAEHIERPQWILARQGNTPEPTRSPAGRSGPQDIEDRAGRAIELGKLLAISQAGRQPDSDVTMAQLLDQYVSGVTVARLLDQYESTAG